MLQRIIIDADPILTEMGQVISDFDQLMKKQLQSVDS